jgi:acetylornithine deacetylase/succinyl-diaminopimelate desuccinylase-like protein
MNLGRNRLLKIQFFCTLLLGFPAQLAYAQGTPADREAKELFTKLVSFRSSAGQGQVAPMAAHLVARLRAAGVPAMDIAELPLGNTAALIVRVPGLDRKARPILFSGHMDVVDARPEDWERNPFELTEENGFYFGRGATDNKAGITAMAITIMRLRRAGSHPARTLLFAFVGDEETEMKTTELIARHPWVRDAEFAINTDAGNGIISEDGKPLIYQIQGAEKTYASFEVVATNQGGHSSKPRTDNAIFDLAEAIARVRALRFPVQSNGITRSYLAAAGRMTSGRLGEALTRFADNPADAEAAEILAADPEYIGTTRTTCIPTRLSAGHADNALPQKAVATINCRIFPGTTKAEVQQTLTEAVANPQLAVKLSDGLAESPVSEMRPDVLRAVSHWMEKHYPGVPIATYMESGATDGLVYRAAGIPTFASSGIFRRNSDNFEHGLNERIPVESFYRSIDHIYGLAVELGGVNQRRKQLNVRVSGSAATP